MFHGLITPSKVFARLARQGAYLQERTGGNPFRKAYRSPSSTVAAQMSVSLSFLFFPLFSLLFPCCYYRIRYYSYYPKADSVVLLRRSEWLLLLLFSDRSNG
jgi:hypothetical protein